MSTDYEIAYILSMTHSGSTLLDALINAHTDAMSVGEVFQIRSYAHLLRERSHKTKLGNQCTCGAPTIWDCPFWQMVAEDLQCHSGLSLRDLDIGNSDSETFARHNKLLFDAIAHVSGARIIVDSSKSIQRFKRLRDSNFATVIPIHLVRDPRGQVFSIMKRTSGKAYRPALRYSLSTLQAVFTLRNERPIRIRYETLVENPEGTLRGVMSRTGLDFDPRQLEWAQAERHNLAGNAMRVTRDSSIKLDERWRKSLKPGQILAINFITYPVKCFFHHDI